MKAMSSTNSFYSYRAEVMKLSQQWRSILNQVCLRRKKMWESVDAWNNYLRKKEILSIAMINMNQWSSKYENDNLPLSTLSIDIDDMKVGR